MVGSLQRCAQKDADTSDMKDLTVPGRIFCFLVVTNWFLHTKAVNDDTRILLGYSGITPKNFSVMTEFVRNFHHLSQFPG